MGWQWRPFRGTFPVVAPLCLILHSFSFPLFFIFILSLSLSLSVTIFTNRPRRKTRHRTRWTQWRRRWWSLIESKHKQQQPQQPQQPQQQQQPVQLARHSGSGEAPPRPPVRPGLQSDHGRRSLHHRQGLLRETGHLRRRLRHLGRREPGTLLQGAVFFEVLWFD